MAGLLLAGLATDAVRRPAHRIRLQELRPLIEEMARDGREGDLAVVNTRAIPAFTYYLRRLGPAGQAVSRFPVVELPGTNRWDAYATRLQALPPASRAWVLYAHHPSWRSQQDEDFVLHVLDGRGQRRRESRTPGASLHLYRLGAASAAEDTPEPAAPTPLQLK
jgi:hypothetical protein